MKIINLLPKTKQEELHYEDLFHSVSIAAMLAVAVLVAGLVVQLGTRVVLGQEMRSVQTKIDQVKRMTNKQENNDIKNQIKLANAQMNDFKNLADSTPAWSRVLAAFARQVPPGVKINSFTGDLQTKKIVINGQSQTRDMVIALYNNISQDTKDFHDINYPLENVAQPTDVAFHFTFYIQKDLLKTNP